MSLHEKIAKLNHHWQERRTGEAQQKRYMGLNGKFGLIVKTLGEPIISQSEGGEQYEVSYFDSPYDEPVGSVDDARTPEEFLDRIPTIQERDPVTGLPIQEPADAGDPYWRSKPDRVDFSVYSAGYHFSGLSSGMHLEIWYKDDIKELRVEYKGYEVYRELRGEILGFAPIEEWELWIERLFKAALKQSKENRVEVENEAKAETKREAKNLWQQLKERWGITGDETT